MLERICAFLRSTMRAPDSPLDSIANEIVLARQYLEIMEARLESRLVYSIECDPQAEMIQIPILLLQPIIENAVKYGIEPASGTLKIEIQIQRSNQGVEIRIRDHGPGLRANDDGQGIKNTKRRLASYYGPAAGFRLSTHPLGGALAELEIPT